MRKIRRILTRTIYRVVNGMICTSGRLLGLAVLEQPVASYDDPLGHRQIRRHLDLVHFITAEQIPLDSRVLDIGCGNGWLARRLQEAGFQEIGGCDWKPGRPQFAPNIDYRQVDLNLTGLADYADHSFDLVVCSDVIEHLENPSYMFREIERVLAPKGHIFFTIPNAFNFFERTRILRTGNSSRYQVEAPGQYGHISMLPSYVLQSLFNRTNLKQVNRGQGYCFWHGYFWFRRNVGPWLSYVAMYHLRRIGDD